MNAEIRIPQHAAPSSGSAALAVAIPAKDEAARLPACLDALAAQRLPVPLQRLTVLVLANDCADGTAAVARAMAPRLPYRLLVEERTLPRRMAHAGGARRVAMDLAASTLAPGGTLLSTDADSRPDPGWLAANRAAIAAGADAVAGCTLRDPAEAIRLPPALRRLERAEEEYAALLDELAALVDPDPHDPWPRHGVHSGASIAVTAAAYRRIGGLPAVPVGEDRALFRTLIRAEMRVRHCPAAKVVVSCRLDGRAAGGMADTLRRRMAETDAAPVDPALEPLDWALLRLRCRHAFRRLRARPRPEVARRTGVALRLPPGEVERCLRLGFWRGWDALEAASPVLRRRHGLRLAALPAEAAKARAVIAALRRPPPGTARPAGSAA